MPFFSTAMLLYQSKSYKHLKHKQIFDLTSAEDSEMDILILEYVGEKIMFFEILDFFTRCRIF